jgi:hypothetical protein
MKKKHVDILHHWSKIKRKQKKEFLSDEQFISFIIDCLLNILGGTVPINSSEFRKFEKELRILTDKATSTDKRGKILASQRGGQLLLFIASPCVKFLFGENAH